jgi:hypothetical protein
MPAYANSAFQTPQLLQKGTPAYLFGAFSQQRGNTLLGLSTDAIATNVATVTAQLVNGPLPNIGDLVSIVNAANSAGAFNVNRAPLTGVAYVVATNVMTLTFALTGTNQGATADGGTVIVEPAEVSEALALNAPSTACLVQSPEGDAQFTIPMSVKFPTLPTSCTVDLQGAMRNNANEWTVVQAAVAVVAAGVQTVGPLAQISLQREYLYRFNVSALTGTGTIIAKIGG